MKERIIWIGAIFTIFTSVAFADLQIRTSLIDSTAYLKNLVLTNNGLTNGVHKINLDGANGNVGLSGNVVAVGNVQAAEICIAGNCKNYWPGVQWEELSGNVYRTSGRVGIGNSTPSTALDVTGVIRATAGLTIISGPVSLPAESITSVFIADGSVTSTDIADGTITAGDILNGTITNNDIASNTITNSNISATASIDGAKILSNFGSQNLIVNGNSFYVDYMSGSVGIGTSLPASELDVRGTVRAEEVCDENGANCIDLSVGVGSASTYSLDSFGGTFTDIVYVDGSANVGVGITSPTYKLDVNGTLRVQDTGAAGTPNLIVGDDAYITDIDTANFLGVYGIQDSTKGGIKLGSTGGYIYGSGTNIGIGTTSPDVKLLIQGTTESNTVLKLKSSVVDSYPSLRFENDVQEWRVYGSDGSQDDKFVIYDGTSSTTKFSIEKQSDGGDIYMNGKVGIGTTTPAESLEVSGNIKITGSGNGLTFPDGTKQTTASGGMWKFSGSSVYNSTIGTTRQNLDLSSIVGVKKSFVSLRIYSNSGSGYTFFRPNGETKTLRTYGASGTYIFANEMSFIMVETDNNGIIQMKSDTSMSVDVSLMGYTN